MKTLLLALIGMMIGTLAYAEEAKQPASIAVTQQDIAELNRVLTEQVPSRWAQPMIEWMNAIIQREQAAAQAPKPEEKAPAPSSPPAPAP